jgi:hypothetical protein
MTRLRLPALLLCAALATGAGAASAQVQPTATASIGVSVIVPFAPLTAAGVRPLQFGSLVPGTPRAVLPSSAASSPSGEWRLTGVQNAKSVDISFSLPTVLTEPGGRTLPISFNGNYAGLCEIDASQSCIAGSFLTWNPVTTPTFRDTPQRWKPGRPKYEFDTYSVYVGGQVSPAASQGGGTYTGTVGIVLVRN